MGEVPGTDQTATTLPQGQLAYNTTQATPAAFGGAVAQAVGSASTDMRQVAQSAEQIKQLHDQTVIDQGFNQLQSGADTLLHGDPNDPSNPGFLSLRGQDALNAWPKVSQQLNELRQNVFSTLQNPAQQHGFDNASRRYQTAIAGQIGSHVDSQRIAYATETAQATADLQVRAASNGYTDPNVVGAAVERGTAAIQAMGAANGWSADEIALKQQQQNAKLYASVIQRASVDNPAAAQSLYDQYKDKLDPNTQIELSRHLQTANTKSNSDSYVGMALAPLAVPGGAPAATAPAGAPSAPVTSIIAHANASGVPPLVALTYASLESNLGAASDRPGNTHTGLFQMGPAEWMANGGTAANRGDVDAQAQVGVASIPKSMDAASAALGRPAQPWEGYLVHQQGAAGGPALLRAPPEQNVVDALAPAYGGNRAAATAAITGNGANPNLTVGDFLGRLQAKYQDAETSVAGINGALPPREVAMGRLATAAANDPAGAAMAAAKLERVYAMQDKAHREAGEAAFNNTVQQIITDPSKVDVSALAADPNLSGEQKWHLNEMVRASLQSGGGDQQLKTYGPKFYDYLQRVTADPADPNRITDPSALWGHVATGDLTVAGVKQLGEIASGKNTPDGQVENKMQAQFLAGAKAQISKDGMLGMRDPQGESRFSDFQTHFFPAYQAARAAGKTPAQLLDSSSPDYLGKSIPQFVRSMPEMTADLNGANGNAAAGSAAPDLTTKGGIVAAYQAGKITRDVAATALLQRGFATATQTAPAGPAVPISE